MAGQIVQIFGFAARQAASGKGCLLQGDDMGGGDMLRDFGETRPHAVGGLDRDLLADDGAGKGLKGIAAIGEDGFGIARDEFGHYRIGGGEFGAGGGPVGGRLCFHENHLSAKDAKTREGKTPNRLRETLNKSFDKLRTNGK
jgi:hypothetical protein